MTQFSDPPPPTGIYLIRFSEKVPQLFWSHDTTLVLGGRQGGCFCWEECRQLDSGYCITGSIIFAFVDADSVPNKERNFRGLGKVSRLFR